MEKTQTNQSGCEFEVFLSFCGRDTRRNLTDFLYQNLVKAGIRTFRDEDELQKGGNIEKILEAIEHSRISIPIFSMNYASREWCMHEVAKMSECEKARKQKILPIFYDVKPSVVREQSGSFKEALLKHEDKFGKETIQRWKDTLREIGSLSGWVLDECFDGHQGKLVDNVVSTIWKELKKNKLAVPDHNIVGIEDMERSMMELLNVDADDTRMVGVFGRPASGKTTLSKIIYNKVSDRFRHCSFLANIREKSQKHGLESLQKQLIVEILQGNCPYRIYNNDDGINIISQRFRTKKVLILLDDIDKKEHLDALAKKPTWFGLGSRIIVTTTNKEILKIPEIYGVFEVMNPQESPRQLLLTKIKEPRFYKNTNFILASLRKNGVSKVGIYGLGGVGKTTLAMNVYDHLTKCENFFDKVYWVSVSHDCSIYNLQSRIARTVDVDLSGEDDKVLRAAKLSEALHEVGNFVLFLDDVWSYFSLENLGISSITNGYKLVLTSRSLEICRRMGCNNCLKVNPLPRFEAWNLFMEKFGNEMEVSSEICQIAQSITEVCAGLPLAIITMASSMRGVGDIHEWRDCLRMLKETKEGPESMELEVYPVLKFSYDHLKDRQLQYCLLYCAVYPEDNIIGREDLIEFFINVGLIKEASREAQFDRGHTILNKLENACLLESATSSDYIIRKEDLVDFYMSASYIKEDCGETQFDIGHNTLNKLERDFLWKATPSEHKKFVKMHDLVRDMALRISKSKFMIKSGQSLQDPPDVEEWTCDLEMISLMSNRIKRIAFSPKCPRLSTLLISENGSLGGIEGCFFECLSGLEVLDLSYTCIKELPDSVAKLVNLKALTLTRCWELVSVPSLAKLSSLRRLDLTGTAIEKVPDGMENLVNLKYLHLRCRKLKKMPIGILPKLSNVCHFWINWPRGDVEALQKGELGCLRKLEIFEVWFRGWNEYTAFLKSMIKPNRYHVIFDGFSSLDAEFTCHLKTVTLTSSLSEIDGSLMVPLLWFFNNVFCKPQKNVRYMVLSKNGLLLLLFMESR